MRKFGFSFSWRRALGLSSAKARLARQIGVPLTRAGQERRLGHAIMSQPGGLPLLLLGGRSGLLGCFGRVVRSAVLLLLIIGGLFLYHRYSAEPNLPKPAATNPTLAKPPPDPTFEDILKQH